MKKFIRFVLPVILWMTVIFAFSTKQKIALTDSYTISFIIFKSLHLIEYMFLYVLCYRAFVNTGSGKGKSYLYAFIITFVYAISDEVHQRLVPTREGKVRDVIIDGLGGGLGWILIKHVLPIAPKSLRNLAKHWQIP